MALNPTPKQKNLIAEAFAHARRGVGSTEQNVQYLFDLLFKSKADQVKEVLSWVSVLKGANDDALAAFDAVVVEQKSAVTTKIADCDAVLLAAQQP